MALILIADDIPDVRELLDHILRHAGHQVLAAVNGAEALTVAHKALPDLVIMDAAMPVVDGWEATRRLKAEARTAQIPVLILSGHASATDRRVAKASGCDCFMTKPFDLDFFLSQVALLTNRALIYKA